MQRFETGYLYCSQSGSQGQSGSLRSDIDHIYLQLPAAYKNIHPSLGGMNHWRCPYGHMRMVGTWQRKQKLQKINCKESFSR